MGNPTAALALAQVFGVERQINKKVEIASWYRELLGENPMISFQKELVHTRSIHWLTSIRIETSQFDRDEFRRNLLTIGIDTRPVFPPISSYPIWTQKYAPNPNAVSIGGSGINLPSGVRLTRFDIERVSEGIQSLL
jgi:perosamine synthetase